MSSIIQSRRDTAANWSSVNPILAQGEKGYETDSIGTSEAKYKIGDGVSTWSALSYQSSGGGGDITEEGTNLKFGTNADFGTGGNRRVAAGIDTTSTGDDGVAVGYNCDSGADSVSIGSNVAYISSASKAIGIGNDIREIEDNSIVITGSSGQSPSAFRTKSKGSVMIGNSINIQSQLPDNTSVNGGVFIGTTLTNNAPNTGALGIMIGNLINRGDAYQSLAIGKNIQMSDGYRKTIAIGDDLILNTNQSPDCVVIGDGAGANTDPNGSIGGQQVAIGKNASSGSWRCTTIGAFSKSDKVSSTVVGYGAYSGMVHGAVFGRGGYITEPLQSTNSITLIYTETTVIGKAYAKFTNPYVEGSDEVVNKVTEQNNGTTVYNITTASGLDADTTPTVTDTKGAILDISGGIGTGTAESGLLTFSSAPASGVSSNVLNINEIAAQIDASAGVDTRFMLLDVTDGTLKRVQFGSDDSAGTGFKVLKVEN